jgi:uncharacterized protein (TIGR02145 family)
MKEKGSISLKIALITAIYVLFLFQSGAQITVTDIDGNVYNTVAIGTQLWMSENLKVSHYRNGDAIPEITDGTTWVNLTTGAFSYYNNFIGNNLIYGKLYNFHAVSDTRHLCPVAWHVPSEAEFNTLISFLDGENFAGGKLKETGTLHWNAPNGGASNETGFTALPGGFRWYVNGVFAGLSQIGQFWSSTQYNAEEAYNLQLNYDDATAPIGWNDKNEGYSVRCVCDFPANIDDNMEHMNNIRIWPNPFSDIVYCNHQGNGLIEIRIFDATGKCLFEMNTDSEQCEMNLQHLNDGVYLIQIISQNTSTKNILIKKQ